MSETGGRPAGAELHNYDSPWECPLCKDEALRWIKRHARTPDDSGPFDYACKKCWHLGGHHPTCAELQASEAQPAPQSNVDVGNQG